MKPAVTSILFGLLATAAMSQDWSNGDGNEITKPDNKPEISWPDSVFGEPSIGKRAVMPGDNVQIQDNASDVAKTILQAKKAFNSENSGE